MCCLAVPKIAEINLVIRYEHLPPCSSITLLHVGKFMKIAILANVLALPVTWFLGHQWLEQFAYKA
jgi:hypothetical protein